MSEITFIFWIANIRKAVRREFEARAASLDITASQFQVLRRLWQGEGIPISCLTKDICSDGGTITGILDRLESKGLVLRERNPEDRREVRLFLTPAGHELEAPSLEILSEINELALEGIPHEQRAELLQLLEQVGGNLGIQ